jgi:hypothetical protein
MTGGIRRGVTADVPGESPASKLPLDHEVVALSAQTAIDAPCIDDTTISAASRATEREDAARSADLEHTRRPCGATPVSAGRLRKCRR